MIIGRLGARLMTSSICSPIVRRSICSIRVMAPLRLSARGLDHLSPSEREELVGEEAGALGSHLDLRHVLEWLVPCAPRFCSAASDNSSATNEA